LVIQGTAADMSEGQGLGDMSTNHGIVKFNPTRFKTIRLEAAKYRDSLSGATTRRNAGEKRLARSRSVENGRSRLERRGGRYQVHHAPQALPRSCIPDVPNHSVYRDNIKKWLTCVVFNAWRLG
jgi:hypothetical protein